MSGCIVMMKLPITVAHSCRPLNHLNSFHRGMFKLKGKFRQVCCSNHSHFECDNHTLRMFTQWHLPPPLTSTMKLSFTHVHSSPLSLVVRLHLCHGHHYCYVNNGWTFTRQISSLHLGILNATATQYTCSLKGIYRHH